MTAVALDHERERVVVVAALAGALGGSWALEGAVGDIAWSWVLPRLRELDLGARVWSELVRAGVHRGLPPEAREELEHAAHETAARAALRAEAARRAGSILDGAGVPWLPMKGAALALVIPEYGRTRPAIDVDVLVRADDLERAGRALGATLPVLGERRDYDGKERDADAAMRDGVQHLHAYEGIGGIPIELHHAFPGLPSREVTDGIFGRSRVVRSRDADIRVPDHDDLLGTACVHAIGHHAGDRKMALRHLADVCELVRAGASPDVARARYDLAGPGTVARSMAALAEARQGARTRGAPPSWAVMEVEPGRAGRLRGWANRVAGRATRILAGVRRRGVDAVLPPRSFMQSLYGPSAKGIRLPLLHVHRWGSIVLRTVRGK